LIFSKLLLGDFLLIESQLLLWLRELESLYSLL